MSEKTSPVNIKKPPQRWKVLLVLNGSCVAGLIISLFTLPSNTPFWWWVAISVEWLVGINFFALRKFQRWEQEPPQTLSTTNTTNSISDFSKLPPKQRYEAIAEELERAALLVPAPPPGLTGEAVSYFPEVFDLIGACS